LLSHSEYKIVTDLRLSASHNADLRMGRERPIVTDLRLSASHNYLGRIAEAASDYTFGKMAFIVCCYCFVTSGI